MRVRVCVCVHVCMCVCVEHVSVLKVQPYVIHNRLTKKTEILHPATFEDHFKTASMCTDIMMCFKHQ